MKTEFVKLIDTTLCTACRGCQVACKQWNEMPGLRTKQWGSYRIRRISSGTPGL
jgi:Fe-S-cluster-containing dehydrogenase component